MGGDSTAHMFCCVFGVHLESIDYRSIDFCTIIWHNRWHMLEGDAVIAGGLILLIAVLVVLIGTKEKEAIRLYYDAVDVTPEMAARGNNQEADSMSSSAATLGSQPAAVEGDQPQKRVSVTMGGAAINSVAKKSSATDTEDTIDELRKAAEAHDPVSSKEKAQTTYSMLRGKKL